VATCAAYATNVRSAFDFIKDRYKDDPKITSMIFGKPEEADRCYDFFMNFKVPRAIK
jgi:hypothetical protein